MEMAQREGEERWGLRHWGSLGRENRGGGGGLEMVETGAGD